MLKLYLCPTKPVPPISPLYGPKGVDPLGHVTKQKKKQTFQKQELLKTNRPQAKVLQLLVSVSFGHADPPFFG